MFCNHHFYFQNLPLSQIDSCQLGSNSPPLIRGLWWPLLFVSVFASLTHITCDLKIFSSLYMAFSHRMFSRFIYVIAGTELHFFFFLGQNNTLSWVYVTFCSFDKQLSCVYFSLLWSHYWGPQTLSVSSAFKNLLGHTVTCLCRSHWKCFPC